MLSFPALLPSSLGGFASSFLGLALSFPGSFTDDAPLAPAALECESRVDPLGIDVQRPRFSWEVSDPRRGAVQSAYEIVVADGATNVWSSGKVASNETCQVEYAGAPLASFHRYAWKVRTYDADGRASPWSAESTFGTGALDPKDWKAQWIGDPTPPPPTHPARYGFQSQFSKDPNARKWVQLDLGGPTVFDEIRLHPAHPPDAKSAGAYLFPLRLEIWACDDPTFMKDQLRVFFTEKDAEDPGSSPLVWKSKAGPFKANFLRVVVLKSPEIEGKGAAFALAEVEIVKEGVVVATGAACTASDSVESGPWGTLNVSDGETQSLPLRGYDPLPAPVLRKEFELAAPAARATLYASALGLYAIRVNGQRVGEDELSPGWTDYAARVPYLAYDVTGLLHSGKNAIAVQLADGWYAGRLGLSWIAPGATPRAIYGRLPRFFAQLEVDPAGGGGHRTFATDATWRATTSGPVREADLLDGERYDARAELRGVDQPGFDDAKWTPAIVASDVHPRLEALACEPVKVVQTKKAVALSEPSPGTWIFDLGQNMGGWCRLNVRAPAGTEIRLRYGEMLDKDGTLYTANLRGAAQTDRYVASGAAGATKENSGEVFEPRFTYHGFRYVEVTGLPAKPELEDLVGCAVGNSARYAGTFHASEPLLDKIWSNIHWTLRANLTSVPTDCPQRDERLGWMGDVAAIAQTAVYQRDLDSFFSKWTADIRDAQAADGRFPDFAPHPYGKDARFTGTPAWGDAGVIVPWTAWVNYGDRRIVEANLDAMLRWLEHVRSKNPDLVWRNDRGNDYGDWLNGDTLVHEGWPKTGASTPGEVLGTAYFARSAALVAKMAAAVGRTDDAKKCAELAEGIRAAFRKAFLSEGGKVAGDSQGAYALALDFDLLDTASRKPAFDRLVKNVEEVYGGHLSTGFASTLPALVELSKGGRHDLAAKLVLDKTFPSWGYEIENGATTLWERWDGFVKDRGFQDAGMNSFDHYAFGAVGEWMMRMLAGIELDPEHPGWSRFTIHPRPCAGLTSLHAERASIRGRIVSGWTLADGAFELEVAIPANTSATVVLPARDGSKLQENGRPIADAAPHVKVLSVKDGEATLDVRAGRYKFRSAP